MKGLTPLQPHSRPQIFICRLSATFGMGGWGGESVADVENSFVLSVSFCRHTLRESQLHLLNSPLPLATGPTAALCESRGTPSSLLSILPMPRPWSPSHTLLPQPSSTLLWRARLDKRRTPASWTQYGGGQTWSLPSMSEPGEDARALVVSVFNASGFPYQH